MAAESAGPLLFSLAASLGWGILQTGAQSAVRRQSRRSNIPRFPAAQHGTLARVSGVAGKDPLRVGVPHGPQSGIFTGQHISAGGPTSDGGREGKRRRPAPSRGRVYRLLSHCALSDYTPVARVTHALVCFDHM